MKLTIEQPTLAAALSSATGVIENRNTIVILGNVLLDASDTGLRITASNLDIWHVESVAAEVSSPGATTVPARTLLDFVRKLPSGGIVTIESKDDTQIVVKSGRSRATLSTLPVEDFPAPDAFQSNAAFTVPAPLLAKVIRKTAFAISTEETRFYLNGVYLHPTGDHTLTAVATNSHILAVHGLPVEENVDGLPGVIIPRQTIEHVAKLIQKVDGPVAIQFTGSKVSFKVGGILVTSRLIDGSFPDYQRAIPQGNEHDALMDRVSLDAAVARVAAIAKNNKLSRAVRFNISSSGIAISARDKDSGAAGEDFIEAEYSGPDIEIGFNSQYIDQIAGAFDGDTVTLSMNADPGYAGVVTSPTEPDYKAVIMPMRV